jgi:ATP-dependent DNA helicase RecG
MATTLDVAMAIETIQISAADAQKILRQSESHFLDFKATGISPARLTKTLSAFANADGGELFIGVSEQGTRLVWDGFAREEDANGHIQAFEEFFPSSAYFRYEFLACRGQKGLILHCEFLKTPDLRAASDGIYYLRRGPQSLPQNTPEQIERLRYDKGLASYEDVRVNAEVDDIANSVHTLQFMLDVVPNAELDKWLAKQRLITDGKPTVAGLTLFSEEPQTHLPKSGIKVYRYRTSGEATRETLDANPTTIEGHAYGLITNAVAQTAEIAERIQLMGPEGLHPIVYPREAIHEIITNAVLHRDYSVNDDIHIRIFDNRVEVQSPGGLPGHVTVQNVLDERFARNPKMVRIINKFPNPPNKDVGEGLNTAFESMRRLQLKDPLIEQRENSVLVTLQHQKLATPEERIIQYLTANDEINNSIARKITFIGSENAVKRIFNKMIETSLIERIPGRPLAKTGYRKGKRFPKN